MKYQGSINFLLTLFTDYTRRLLTESRTFMPTAMWSGGACCLHLPGHEVGPDFIRRDCHSKRKS